MSASESISTYSLFSSVTNTVDLDGVFVQIQYYDENDTVRYKVFDVGSDGFFSIPVIDDFKGLSAIIILMESGALPTLGKYEMQVDFASNISIPFNGDFYLRTEKLNFNANKETQSDKVYPEYNDGDMYFYTTFDLDSSVYLLRFVMYVDRLTATLPINGDLSIAFTKLDSSAETDISSAGSYSSVDAESAIADSSSQTAQNTSVIASATESMAAHFTDLLSQVTYISDQIFSFWEQWASFHWSDIFPHITSETDRIIDALGDMTGLGSNVTSNTDRLIANDNANHQSQIYADDQNTEEVKDAIEEHGNFIIEGLKSLFIPSEDYFPGVMERLQAFFEERLGFLFAPMDILLDLLGIFLDASPETASIPIPDITWEGQTVLSAQSIDFSIWNEFPELQEKIYFLSNLILVGAVLSLIQRKATEVLNR